MIARRTCKRFSFRRVKDYQQLVRKIDSEVGADGTMTIEYIFTKPKWKQFFALLFNNSQSSGNPYGHSAIRYVDPTTGRDTVMNVCGLKGHRLINFIPAEEYLFTDIFHEGNEQGGVFNRSFIGLRVENIPVENVRRLAEYYKQLDRDHEEGKIKFFILPLSFLNPIRRLLGYPQVGNCCVWTSKALHDIGVLPRTYSWPLLLFFEMIRAQKFNLFKHLNIISYLSMHYPAEPRGSFIYPFYWLKKGYAKIWNLDELSNLIVVLDTTRELYREQASLNPQPVDADLPVLSPQETAQLEAQGEHQVRLIKQKHISERYSEVLDKLKGIFK